VGGLIAKGYNEWAAREQFRQGNGPSGMNLVLWTWRLSTPSRLELIDDDDRLSRTAKASHGLVDTARTCSDFCGQINFALFELPARLGKLLFQAALPDLARPA